MKNYTIDHISGTITMTKAFAKAASKHGTPEYNEIVDLRRDFPTYEVKQREAKKATEKKTYAHLTYKRMEVYIRTMYGERSPQEETYQKVRVLSKSQSGAYAYVKKWFLASFPKYAEIESLIENEMTESSDNTLKIAM